MNKIILEKKFTLDELWKLYREYSEDHKNHKNCIYMKPLNGKPLSDNPNGINNFHKDCSCGMYEIIEEFLYYCDSQRVNGAKDTPFEWNELSDYHDYYITHPDNHDSGCRCRQFTLGGYDSKYYAECAVDQCDCNTYETIERFLMYIKSPTIDDPADSESLYFHPAINYDKE